MRTSGSRIFPNRSGSGPTPAFRLRTSYCAETCRPPLRRGCTHPGLRPPLRGGDHDSRLPLGKVPSSELILPHKSAGYY